MLTDPTSIPTVYMATPAGGPPTDNVNQPDENNADVNLREILPLRTPPDTVKT
jgi:hypothetical protein